MSQISQALSVRIEALRILERVERKKAYSNVLLQEAISMVAPEQFPFLEQLVKGTLESRTTLERVLNQHLKKGLTSLPFEFQLLLKLSAYQILYLKSVPSAVSVSLAIDLVKNGKFRGLAGLANATLRNISRIDRATLEAETAALPTSEQFSHPKWLVDLYTELLGEDEAAALCAANNKPSPLWLRVNSLRATREEVTASLHAEGIETTLSRYSPDSLAISNLPRSVRLPQITALKLGHAIVQDEASSLIAPLLQAESGMTILDLCAAPGGKSTHLAALTEQQSPVISCDRSKRKLSFVRDNCAALGINSVRTVAADGRALPFSLEFDRILVDAPCSGLGVVGKRADIRWSKNPDEIVSLHRLQLELLDSAAKLLRQGGIVVYSTCTVTRLENESTIEAFLANHAEFCLAPVELPSELCTPEGYLRSWPHRHGMAGGFAAVLRKQ